MNKKLYLATGFCTQLLAVSVCADNNMETTASFSTLKCLGSEPFWSLDVNRQKVTLEDLSSNQLSFQLTKATTSINHTNRWFLTANNSKKDNLSIALIKTNQCSDDMSDFNYEYEVIISTPEAEVLSGCCNRVKQSD